MNITWLGHSGFRLEIEDEVRLIDPWIPNPLFPSNAGQKHSAASPKSS